MSDAASRPEANLIMDLRAMRYPATLKETKACLLQVPVRDVVELYVDDERSATDMPEFLRRMGHDVWVEAADGFTIVVVKKNQEP